MAGDATFTTRSSNATQYRVWRDGQVEYPCRCGETHRGEWAFTDWMHHECFHDAPLWQVHGRHYICADCGKDFGLAEGDTEGAAPDASGGPDGG